MLTPIVIPVKPPAQAKTRLAAALTLKARAALTAWMLDRVLLAAGGAGTGPLYVVGGDGDVMQVAHRRGALTLPELGQELNSTLAYALRLIRGGDRRACIVLAADLPRLTPEDVVHLWRVSRGGQKAIVAPSHDHDGTNALVVPSACVFHPSFGLDSRQAHRAVFERQGYAVQEVRTPGLLHDVDVPGDLDDLLSNLPSAEASQVAQILRSAG